MCFFLLFLYFFIRQEIWDALKAAAGAIECLDYSLAQAIIDGASITLPHGTLTDCYDELGTRYQVPVYCFSLPVNVLQPGDRTGSLHSGAAITLALVFRK